jgi:inositol phosphorylceramide synthase catalytic subunit
VASKRSLRTSGTAPALEVVDAIPFWQRVVPTLLVLAHTAIVGSLGGLRAEHFVGHVFLATFPWIGPRAARFALIAIPVWLSGMLVDAQRFWLDLRGTIHTGDLFELERRIFPLGGRSISEWIVDQQSTVLDVFCGLAYATYIGEVIIAAALLFMARSQKVWVLAWAFLAMNIMAIVTYLVYPAAPPWYIAQYGPGPADLHAAASAAGAARFDSLIGIPFFSGFYSRNPNVFGAMPSLHVAYPLLVALVGWSRGWWWRVPTLAYAALMAFAAVYLQHHYILDVLAGWAVAIIAATVVSWAVGKLMASSAWHRG